MHDISRREFVSAASRVVALGAVGSGTRLRPPPIGAVAFDGFALFDATAVLPLAEAIVPGRGRELVAAWRARHFEYQWLRTLGGRYADFQTTAADALSVAAATLGLAMSRADRDRLVEGQAELRPWPDAAEVVRELRRGGVRLVVLSNMTASMIDGGLRRAGLSDAFEAVLSTDRVRAAKPAPQAYAMGEGALGLARGEIAFVGFAGWDVAGATWFGYPTAWLNRANAKPEELGASPRVTADALAPIAQWIFASR
jgi:2-haloacid dehalogenase